MGLLKYGIAVGIGYYLGQPGGRRQLQRLRQQSVELTRRPEVEQLRERGRDIAGKRVLAAKDLASQTFGGKDRAAGTAGKHEAAENGTVVDDTPAAASTARHRGIRGIGRRRPRPHPASLDTAGTPAVLSDSPAAGGEVAADDAPTGIGSRTVVEDSPAPTPSSSVSSTAVPSQPSVPPPDRS